MIPSGLAANRSETLLRIVESSSALAYFRYTTSIDLSALTSASRETSVFSILDVIVEFADNITEFDGLNGMATKLLIVGLF